MAKGMQEADKLKKEYGRCWEGVYEKKDITITKASRCIMDNVKERAREEKADAEESTEE